MLKATDARFASLRCSALHGLSVAVTGIPREERLEVIPPPLNIADVVVVGLQVKRLLESNGAIYSASLLRDETSLLLCSLNSSDKYEKARQWNVPCLSIR